MTVHDTIVLLKILIYRYSRWFILLLNNGKKHSMTQSTSSLEKALVKNNSHLKHSSLASDNNIWTNKYVS